MKKTTTYLIRFLLFAGSVLYVQAEALAQERWINATYVKNGMVDTGNSSVKLAVRSGPGLNYSQVDSLSSGQKVTASKSKDGWIRLSSTGTSVEASSTGSSADTQERWINAAYVKNGVVDTGSSSAKLAVRSGPGMNFGQIDTISFGEKVTSNESKNGWIRIASSGAIPVAAAPKREPARAKRNSEPASVARQAPVPEPVAVPPVQPRPVPAPVRPPVGNLILSGDFSGAALALPSTAGDTTAELSGRWLRSVISAWEISPYGGNLGAYVRAAASREAGRLLYVVNDAKRSTGSYVLRFDYILADPSDVLGVKVFVSDSDITVGTDGGNFRMNNSQRPADMVMLPASASWSTYYLPVELGGGYNYVYVLAVGSGAGNTGIDNVSLSPQRR
ncbi:MAG: SH3 domain-containing protein [Kiritimatiellales bacterium]|jgi:uncharacterized protein YraI